MNGDFAKRRCYSRRVRDSDPYGRRHFSGSVALGGSAALVQYSPTQRDDFVKCDSAGARPKNFQTLNGYEAGLFGMEGRGLYAGGNVGGVYAQVAQNGGWSYGFQEEFYYRLVNNGPKEKFVGFQVGPFDFMYDHDARNENQPDFKTKEEFEKYANANEMETGFYPESQSREHNPSINDKMWMAKSKPLSLFNLLLTIPSIEGVFKKDTGKSDTGSASYNYGNNWSSHFFLDYLPWKMMDVWFPNP